MITSEGGEAAVLEVDVTRNEDCRAMVEETLRRWGRLDGLDNNVGIGGRATVVEVDEAGWDHLMRVNVTSMMLTGKHAIPAMARSGGGSIINISSISALRPARPHPLSGTACPPSSGSAGARPHLSASRGRAGTSGTRRSFSPRTRPATSPAWCCRWTAASR